MLFTREGIYFIRRKGNAVERARDRMGSLKDGPYGTTKPFEKAGLIFVVPEYFRFVEPSHHDVMQGAGDVQTGLAWHGASLRDLAMFVKHIDT